MSALTDRITREHKIGSIGGNGKTEIAFCACGARCENEDDGDDGFLAGYWRHIAERAEQAVREQIASELHKWGIVADECGRWSYAEIWWDAEAIARGEG